MRWLLVVVLALALCAPASAQAPPPDLWESAPAAGGGSVDSGGRDALRFVLALVVFAAAGGTAVLALRTPRRADPSPQPVADLPRAERAPEPAPVWHPRVSGPPPLPAFGPGSHSGPSAAPPPPET